MWIKILGRPKLIPSHVWDTYDRAWQQRVTPDPTPVVASRDRDPGDDPAFPNNVSPLVFLTGDALGFSGADQLRVDLCLAFGTSLSDWLSGDLDVPFVTEDQKVAVAIGGFLAAAPVLGAEWDIDLFEADSAWAASGRRSSVWLPL